MQIADLPSGNANLSLHTGFDTQKGPIMEKTMCELFAGVGGFRLGLDRLNSGWKTTWFSQWEPGKKKQWAHACYLKHYGDSPDLKGESHTCEDIATVIKEDIPDHTLLVGGFPCQDYSVAHSLSSAKGIEGKKGVLWWQIRDTIIAKKPPFVLLENVDRLLKSPASQRGRDFGMILTCLTQLGYDTEWRVVNAADYGASQRRRRTFIFAYSRDTVYAETVKNIGTADIILKDGFMAKSFPVVQEKLKINTIVVPLEDTFSESKEDQLLAISERFIFPFEISGYVKDGVISTCTVTPDGEEPILLGDILQKSDDEGLYIVTDRLKKWIEAKGSKRIPRKSANGHEYIFSEGPVAFPDPWNRPGRTMLTSESTLNRSTHVVSDPGTGMPRILTPIEAERLQGFDDDWTKYCLMDGEDISMPARMRYFCMGNALVVPMITRMGKVLDAIIAFEK